jgi:hypothetical protein
MAAGGFVIGSAPFFVSTVYPYTSIINHPNPSQSANHAYIQRKLRKVIESILKNSLLEKCVLFMSGDFIFNSTRFSTIASKGSEKIARTHRGRENMRQKSVLWLSCGYTKNKLVFHPLVECNREN